MTKELTREQAELVLTFMKMEYEIENPNELTCILALKKAIEILRERAQPERV